MARPRSSSFRPCLMLACGIGLLALTGCGMSERRQRISAHVNHTVEPGSAPDRALARSFGLDEFAPRAGVMAAVDSDRR